ncbi:hypothetical protein XHC_0836 [Xanthomonas hortorum pv. carotae str. M081]|nr:hypothetical protein XHC_0836 [Xanthomonas hortorum pv. carotae str. M081]
MQFVDEHRGVGGGDGQCERTGQGKNAAQGHSTGRQPHRQLLVIGECVADCKTCA